MRGRCVVVVGTGAVGCALARSLAAAPDGFDVIVQGRYPDPPAELTAGLDRVEYVYGASLPPERCLAVLLAVAERAIPEAAVQLAAQGVPSPGTAAFHLSGAMSTEVLSPLHRQGYQCGVFHPLVPAPMKASQGFAGAPIALTGGVDAMHVGRIVAEAIGGVPLPVPAGRGRTFFAAAAMVSGLLTPVLERGVALMERGGVSETDARSTMARIVRGGLDRFEAGGEPGVVGPLSHGDVEAADLHLRALEGADRSLYAAIGQEILSLTHPLDDETRRELEDLFARHSGASTPATLGA